MLIMISSIMNLISIAATCVLCLTMTDGLGAVASGKLAFGHTWLMSESVKHFSEPVL